MESFLRQGASLKGTSLLEDAALRGSEAIVGVLLEHGAEVDEVNDGSGTTALYAAASFGKGNVVETLLLHGAKANLCGRNHKTAYRAAVDGGFGEVANLIQSRGGGKSCEPAGR